MEQLGHFHILARIGVGGMGEVYRAYDEKLQREVALKVVRPERIADAAARHRLVEEARAAAALNHPHICVIHEVGEANGRTFIAMERVDGVSLDARLKNGALAASDVIRYGIQLADAVAHAHQRNIIHRDLKPSNVVLTPDGHVKVLDFGVAKRVTAEIAPSATTDTVPRTAQGIIIGTPAYMAPEQLLGAPADRRSDIWSLGVMLYEMAAGRRPFGGATWAELSTAILTTEPPPLPKTVPSALTAIIERCLTRDPGARYQRASAIHAALETVQPSLAAAATVRRAHRFPRSLFVAAAGAILMLVAALLGTRLGEPNRGKPVTVSGALTIQQLAGMGVRDVQSISGDGKKALVIDYSRGQNLEIYDFDTGQSRLLTTYDWTHSWVYGGIWSPDTSQVAYTQGSSKPEGAIVLRISDLRGLARTVFRVEGPNVDVTPVAWLPDGKAIATIVARSDEKVNLGLVTLADGKFSPIRSISYQLGDRAALSPDGRFIAYVNRVSSLGDIHVVSVDGIVSSRVTDDPADDYDPLWSSDGKHLAFLSKRLGGEALWAVAMTGSERYGQPMKLADGMQGVSLIQWLPEGIVAAQRLRTADVYTIEMDRAAGRSIGTPRPIQYRRSGANFSPAWSPDGRHLAFISSSLSERSHRFVAIVPVAGGESREFLIPSERPYLPNDLRGRDLQWFGNGKGLGFSDRDEAGKMTAFHLALATGEWTTYPLPVKEWTRTAWNNQGTAFCYARNSPDPSPGIFERTIDGKRERRLFGLDSRTMVRDLEFSTDRQWLAFSLATLDEGDVLITRILAVNVRTGETKTVASLTGDTALSSPSLTLSGWAPGGGVVIQRWGGADAPTKWVEVPLDGSPPRPLDVAVQGTGGTAGAPRFYPVGKWSPSGSTMAFTKTGFSGGMLLIRNPLAAARQDL